MSTQQQKGAIVIAKRKLGKSQEYILNMVNPEWPTPNPDSRSLAVLVSLEAKGFVYRNYGKWYISDEGKNELSKIEL